MEEQCSKCEEWFKDDEIYLNIPHTDIYYCKTCFFHDQPERLNPEDALIRKFFEENPSYYNPNGDLPLILDKNGRQLTHEEILSICDSPNIPTKGSELSRND